MKHYRTSSDETASKLPASWPYNLGQGKKLCKEDAEAFHPMVVKVLFVCK